MRLMIALSLICAGLDVAGFAQDGGLLHIVCAAAWLTIAGLEIDQHRRKAGRSVVYVVGDPYDTETNPRRRQAAAAALVKEQP